MRKLLAFTLALALLGAAGTQALARPSKSVKVGDDYFVHKGSPATITVSKGTRVSFHFRGSSLHNVHAVKGPARFRSDLKRSGTFSKVLRKRGTYRIVCDIHQPSMRMTIKVR